LAGGKPPAFGKEVKCENVANVLGVVSLWEYLSLIAQSIPIARIVFKIKVVQYGRQDRQFVVIHLAFG
jgi:hypothetical protein